MLSKKKKKKKKKKKRIRCFETKGEVPSKVVAKFVGFEDSISLAEAVNHIVRMFRC